MTGRHSDGADHAYAQGTRGAYPAAMRNGVSRIRSGKRFTVYIMFHDAT